ncbi:MAG TPA: glycosyltransferase, partial [Methanobacterium sp.]
MIGLYDRENKVITGDSRKNADDPQRQLKENEENLDHLQKKLIQAEESLKSSDMKYSIDLESSGDELKDKEAIVELIEEVKKQIKGLKSQINTLTSRIYEMEYYSNTSRSFKQRLISRFPSLYLLFNRNNQGIKNAFLNIKGYRAIRKHHLFDVGYYLKNNVDVRLSGVDPLIHYIYFGFEEGRKPDPNFDGDYYQQTYQDVQDSNLNPLVHYSLYGINEGRKTIKSQQADKLPSKERERLENKYSVSVIMPTYNREGVIGRAIDSVLNQTFSNFELIIVDDGSTDNTKSLIINDYGKHLKSGKIKYFKEKNSGVSKARNKGLSEAEGDVIAYLDSDNYWLDTYLEKMVSALSNNNRNTTYSAIEVTDNYRNRKLIRNTKYDRNKLLKGSFIDLNVFVHKRFLYHQLGGFNESLTRLVDWDLILRYTRLNEPYFVDEVLARYFSSSELNNISNTVSLDDNKLKVQRLHQDEIIRRGLDDLRIAYVLWDFPTFSQTFVINELRWLVENNYDVKVFYKVEPDKEAELDFDIEAIKVKNSSELVKKIEEHHINMMHSHFVFPACTRLTYPAAEKTGVPFTVFAHAIDIFHKRNDKRNKVEEIGKSKYCKRIFVLGKFHYDYLARRGVPEEKLMFLRQATSYQIERGVSIDSPRFNREIKNIITVTRFVDKKGIDTLIRAAKLLKEEDLVFKIYGYGPLEKDLKKLISKLDLTNVVMEGLLKGDEALKEAYEDGDLFVLPCKVTSQGDMDGMPTVIFEAMAYGVPVITTN